MALLRDITLSFSENLDLPSNPVDVYKSKRLAGCLGFDLILKIVSAGIVSALCSILLP
jgi:hypothetical protein